MKAENFKTILVFQIIVILSLSGCLFLIEPAIEKDILQGVCLGLFFSVLLQVVLFRLKANWFDEKVKNHPHEIKN